MPSPLPGPALQGLNLNRIAVFVAVAEHRSFTAAAQALQLGKTVVSQHVARLEDELKTQLLVRSTRRLSLTEAGRHFHAAGVAMLRQAEEAVAALRRGHSMPVGRLRITTTQDFANTVVARAVGRFASDYPEVRVEIVATDEVRDLLAEGLDLAVRVGWLRDSGLRAVRLGGAEQLLLASPAYLDSARRPRRPEDLRGHRAILLTQLEQPARWTFSGPDGRTRTVTLSEHIATNSASAIRALLHEGLGLAVLPAHMVAEDLAGGTLVNVLPRHRLPEVGVHVVHPYQPRLMPLRVRLFIDCLRAVLAPARGVRARGDG